MNNDYVDQVHPASSQQISYIMIATAYWTKWAEVRAMKKDNVKTSAMFSYKNIVTRFGYPKVLVSGRGSHFVKKMIVELTAYFKIVYWIFVSLYAQTNGQMERMNQTSYRILRKTVDDLKRDWNLKFFAALWIYCMTYKVTTHITLLSLVYGIEVILSIEFEIQEWRCVRGWILQNLLSTSWRL